MADICKSQTVQIMLKELLQVVSLFVADKAT